MSTTKEIFYDWAGKNDQYFLTINHIRDTSYDIAMQYISWLSEPKHFKNYMIALFIGVALFMLFRVLRGYQDTWWRIQRWIGVFIVLGGGFFICHHVIQAITDYFSYPRPYIVYNPNGEMYRMENLDRIEDFQSMPADRVSFTVFMVTALWPMLGAFTSLLGIAAVLLVSWSRISMGMSFPADVIYALLITIPLVVVLRWVVYFLLRRIARIECS